MTMPPRGPRAVHEHVVAAARRCPHAIALELDGEATSYRALVRRAGVLASHLRTRCGVGPEDVVGVCLRHPVDHIVAVLAVLRAGAAFLPLDPAQPSARVQWIVEDARARVVVVDADAPALAAGARELRIDRQRAPTTAAWTHEPPTPDERLAYVVYTSGTTGRPKGVMVEHRALANHCEQMLRCFALDASDRVLQLASPTFDVWSEEVFPSLATGATLVLRSPREVWTTHELLTTIERRRISLVNIPASYWRVLVEDMTRGHLTLPSSLRLVVVGSEASRADVLRDWAELPGTSRVRWLNAYGPTEATITTTVLEHAAGAPIPWRDTVPVGDALEGVDAYVLDDAGELLGPEQVGELCLGGVGVARGYLGRPALTAARFVPDPRAARPGTRMVRTGDRARRLPHGGLEVLGRIDRQLKLRGYRIEPAEIEAVLVEHPRVDEAVVEPRGDGGAEVLVAVLGCAGEPPSLAEVDAHVRATLPAYMCPAAYAVVPRLPRVVGTGKLDAVALAALEPTPLVATAAGLTARTETERAVVALWGEVLGLAAADVPVDVPFLGLGGHSLAAASTAARLREAFSIELSLAEVLAATVADLAVRLEGDYPTTTRLPPITRAPESTRAPLSYAQEALWLLGRLTPESVAYQFQSILHLEGRLDVEALRRSLHEIVRRHEILRTTFIEDDDGRPYQVVHAPWMVELTPRRAGRELEVMVAAEVAQRIDPTQLPLVRWILFEVDAEHHALLIIEHHFVHDGWSLGVFVSELGALYRAFVAGQGSPLPELPIQYVDFAAWQRSSEMQLHHERMLAVWVERLAGVQPLELPADRPRPRVQSFRGDEERLVVPVRLRRRLERLGSEHGVTLFMVMLAGFQALLARYCGQTDVCIGSTDASRHARQLEPLLGMIVSTTVLRTDLDGDPTLTELLARTRATVLDAHQHGPVPFEKIVEALGGARDLSRNPVFQVTFNFHDARVDTLEAPGLRGRLVLEKNHSSKFDISLIVIPHAGQAGTSAALDDGIEILWEYCVDLFDASTIVRMHAHYLVVLEAMVEHPHARLSDVSLLTAAELDELRSSYAASTIRATTPCRADELVARRAALHPEAVAAVFEQRHLRYAELERRVNQLAHRLRRLGAGPGALVGLCVDRSLEMLVGLLGILRAGAAYLPIDPGYPRERQELILADAGVSLLVTQADLLRLPLMRDACGKTTIVALDPELTVLDVELASPPRSLGGSHSLAYVIYTSGSTGRPKGVEVEHHGVVNLLEHMASVLLIGPGDVFLAVTSPSFDIAVLELLLPLCCGATVDIAARPVIGDGAALARRLLESGARYMQATPATWELLVQADWRDTELTCLCGGEALSAALAGELLARTAALWNLYGPTETTVWSTMARVESATRAPPLGRPIANTRTYVLDERLEPVPTGVAGQLWLAGDGVTRGYHRRARATATSFVPDRWSTRPGDRMYATGDKARVLADGTLEFLGRLDHQVKVRGHRIELGEVEAALSRHPGVARCVATVRTRTAADASLVAYVVPRSLPRPTTPELLEHLRQTLPAYMIPAAIVELEELPLTPNGKLDRRALPAPPASVAMPDEPPQGAIQRALAHIFAEVLGRETVGAHADFFELGGHSLSAARVVALVRRDLGVVLALSRLFESPTVAGLAGVIEREHGALEPTLAPTDDTGVLSFAQERISFMARLETGPLWHVPQVWRLRGPLDVAALRASVHAIIERHESLRTTFHDHEHGPVARVHAHVPGEPFELVERVAGETWPEPEFHAAIEAACTRPFYLDRGPLLRVVVLRVTALDHVLAVTMHHIVCDAWSLGVFQRELKAGYATAVTGVSPRIDPLPIQYHDYASWQRRMLHGDALARLVGHWRERLEGAPSLLQLPLDHPRPMIRSYRGARHPLRLSGGVVAELARLGRAEGATLFMVLLATFEVLLRRLTGADDLVVGVPVGSRTHPRLEELIGPILDTLPVRSVLDGRRSFRTAVARVRNDVLEALDHRELPFERIVEAIGPTRSPSYSPVFQVMFELAPAQPDSPLLHGLEVETIEHPVRATEYDLTMAWVEDGAGLRGALEYDSELFDPATIARFAERWDHLVRAVLRDPELPLDLVEFRSEAEIEQLRAWADGGDAESAGCIFACFDAVSERWPRAIAVEHAGAALSYARLRTMAATLAGRLRREHGIGPGCTVAVAMQPSLLVPAVVLGILAAGAAYLPLNPRDPEQRQAAAIADANAAALLVSEGSDLASPAPLRLVVDPSWFEHPLAQRPPRPRPTDLAYVIFTSGSTGRPKGVMVDHRALANHCEQVARRMRLTREDRVLQLASLNFDVSLEELLATLCCGATVILRDDDVPLDADSFLALVARHRLSVVNLPASYWRELTEAMRTDAPARLPSSLRLVVVGNEPTLATDLARWSTLPGAQRIRWLNAYGPTEATITATTYEHGPASPALLGQVPVGRPLANVRARALDRHGIEVPVGVAGELYLGGHGVAWGYLGQPAATAASFVPAHWAHSPGARVFRTGDRARWLPSGQLQLLGRHDRQVKLRGHRVELGEIEAALRAHADVRDALVDVIEHAGGPVLVAVVETGAAGEPALRRHLEPRLPSYMIPSQWHIVEEVPRTASGKIDRARVLASATAPARVAISRPRSATEQLLGHLWAELFEVGETGDEDFFALGGHSLLALRLLARVRAATGISVPIRELFAHPRPSSFARCIESARWPEVLTLYATPVIRRPAEGEHPMSLAQERLWRIERVRPPSGAYNVYEALRLRGPLDRDALAASLDALVRRHAALRTSFAEVDGRLLQRVGPPEPLVVDYVDLEPDPDPEHRVLAAQALASDEVARAFDLGGAPLVRATLQRLGHHDHVLLLVLHHIVCDGWSMRVLLDELAALYNSPREPAALPNLDVQYPDFAAWQREHLRGEVLTSHLDYWRQQLAEVPTFELSGARPRPPEPRFAVAHLPVAIDEELRRRVVDFGARHAMTEFMTLLAGFAACLAGLSGQLDFAIGTPTANRERPEFERVMGDFVHGLALRMNLRGSPSFVELTQRVREVTLSAFAHRELPFHTMVEALGLDRTDGRHPVFQVVFAFDELSHTAPTLHELDVSRFGVAARPARPYDIILMIIRDGDSLHGVLVYDVDMYTLDHARQLEAHFLHTLSRALAEPDRPVLDLGAT